MEIKLYNIIIQYVVKIIYKRNKKGEMNILSKRQKDIIKLLERKEEYITIKGISEKFDVSPCTIRNDLDIIESIIN